MTGSFGNSYNGRITYYIHILFVTRDQRSRLSNIQSR